MYGVGARQFTDFTLLSSAGGVPVIEVSVTFVPLPGSGKRGNYKKILLTPITIIAGTASSMRFSCFRSYRIDFAPPLDAGPAGHRETQAR